MNEGGNLISSLIQFGFQVTDARSRRKRVRQQAEAAQALEEKIADAGGYAVREDLLEESPEDLNDTVGGISQISAEGKACLPCSSDHFAGVASMLSESIRFARDGGLQHPEVVKRIAHAEEEIAALEREDGSPDNVIRLPDDERALMNNVLINCRKLRHIIWDVKTVEALEDAAAKAQNYHRELKRNILDMSMARLPLEAQDKIKTRAREIISEAMEGEE